MTEPAATEKRGGAAPQGRDGPDGGRLAALAAAVGTTATRGPAPVESWHPPYCGEIDLRIAADGTWVHEGRPILRRPMVEAFARLLRRDAARYVLVTPAECVGIVVDDVPFVAVALVMDDGHLRFVTNVGDETTAGADHPMRFETDADGGVRPYVHVRGGLWARLTRSLAVDVIGAAESRRIDGRECLGIRSGAAFFAIDGASSA